MNCIFCKSDSSASTSVEHIIPESLGNTEHVLPVGVVCDRCNSYFARKVEKPLLETPYFRDLCFRARIRNKKGNPPRVAGLHVQSRVPVELLPDMDGSGASIAAAHPHDEKRWIENLHALTRGTIILSIPTDPDEQLVSRFLAKVAVEVLAARVLNVPGGLTEITEKKELDPLRDYARKGSSKEFWPYHKRVLYPPDFWFHDDDHGTYQIPHEWTLLYTEANELYLVLALFGVEYALNLGNPEIDGYETWLSASSGRSPLYPDGIQGM